jgi:hypothetical protein
MKNLFKLCGIIVLVTAAVASSSAAEADTSLNGTWLGKIKNDSYQMIFKDGNYTSSINGHVSEKGTYTTTGKTITMTTTHAHGDWMIANDIAIQKKWYTKTELETALKGKMSDKDITKTIKNFFTPQKIGYSVKEDRLTWRGTGGSLVFKKAS